MMVRPWANAIAAIPLRPAPSPTTAAAPAPMNTNAKVPMNSARSLAERRFGMTDLSERSLIRSRTRDRRRGTTMDGGHCLRTLETVSRRSRIGHSDPDALVLGIDERIGVRAVTVHSPFKLQRRKKVVTRIEKTVLELLPLCETCDDTARVKAFRD